MFNNLRSVMFFSFISMVVLTLLFFWFFSMPRVKESTNNLIVSELYRQALLSADSLTGFLRVGDDLALQKRVCALSDMVSAWVTVLDAAGRVRADSSLPREQVLHLENHLTRPEIVMARTQGKGSAVYFSASLRQERIYAAIPLKNTRGQLVGYLRLSVPADRSAIVLGRFYRHLIFSFVVALAAVVIISGFLAQMLASPIARLTRVAEKIASGEFPQTILRRSRFEIGRLEEAVEKMSKKLADNFQKINAQKGQMTAILASMAEGVLAFDQNGKIILANQVIEKTFGIIELDVLGKSVREAILNNEIADLADEVLRSRQPMEKEISIITPIQGSFIAGVSPIYDRAGNFLGGVAVLFNVTEIRRLERHRSEFVANVSHELKTPLTVICSAVETLLDGGALADPQVSRDFARKIQKHSANLSRLIDDILEISRLEAKKELGPFVRLSLPDLICRAVETVAESARQKNVTVENHVIAEKIFIRGIEDHVYRAMVNLLNNAVNYNKYGGRVDIYCRKIIIPAQDPTVKPAEEIEVKIVDTGIGIAAPHLSRIFERFYRTDAARSRELGGTGLGLAIVKHVMNIHGGMVAVESKEGEGSVFTLIFPGAA
jgi:two-component system phosphate regulon sensor histidine kinase PhoR